MSQKNKLNELTSIASWGGQGVDDGPNVFYSDFSIYSKTTIARAEKLGFKVVDFLVDNPDFIKKYPWIRYGNQGSVMKSLEKDLERKKVFARNLGFKIMEHIKKD